MTEDSKRNIWKYSEPQGGASRLYANQLNLFWSGVDVTIVFGELLQDQQAMEEGKLSIEQKAKITVPWSVAKLILTQLSGIISEYEKANGELKLPGQYTIPVGDIGPRK
jgi:hypothetical protein